MRGEEVIWYSDQQEIEELKADDVVVDYVRETQTLLNDMGIQPPHFDYPTALNEYFGRGIRRGKIGEVVNHPEIWPVFIKPVDAEKSFTGRVVGSTKDLIGIGLDGDFPVWISEPVIFVKEWRSFILNNQVLDVRPYAGDYHVQFDGVVLDAAVNAWRDSPGAYSLDIGVTRDGRTLVIEVNDGYSLGCYGLNPYKYAVFLETRWHELTKPYFKQHVSFSAKRE